MSPTLVTTLAVLAAIGWLAFIGVSALRSKGSEEIPANLSPGITDDVLETRRLERTQMAAVMVAGFLAVGMPLYYLFETPRQEAFVDQFHEESVDRGAALVVELGCYGCHGPGGSGGNAAYTEKRTGASVLWAAPALNNVFYRYNRDEVAYWVTYGRGNSPMPAWGTPGGGPLTSQQVDDIVNYLESQQVTQAEAAGDVEAGIAAALSTLAGAEDAMATAILNQRQLLAEIERSSTISTQLSAFGKRATTIGESAAVGVDSDGDGVSDKAETDLNALTAEIKAYLLFPGLEDRTFDPANPATDGTSDLVAAQAFLDAVTSLGQSDAPILSTVAAKVAAAIAAPGEDGDGDGLADGSESQISAFVTEAQTAVLPRGFGVASLDPINPESMGGRLDSRTLATTVASIETIALNAQVNTENQERLLSSTSVTLNELLEAQEAKRWEFDAQAVADIAFGGDLGSAERVIGIFNAYCARCHTSGWSAGVPFSQEAGSGGFGPALWDGRPAIQFLSDEDLKDFLIVGAELNKPYGVNGFGSGRMPAFGKILSEEDLLVLAKWLRAGDLTGKGPR